jgi:hypothetical protein
MHTQIPFEYRFHAAGQGIFASGTLHVHGNQMETSRFHWVFDCGSTAPVTVLKPKVLRYRNFQVGARLDLLCISHFDHDHVSGLDYLLKDLHLGTVVMPYLTPLERLVLGCSYEGSRASYLRFLADPIGYITALAGSVERIVQVGGFPPEDNEDLPGEGNPPPRGRNDGEWELQPDFGREMHRARHTPNGGTEIISVAGSFAAVAGSRANKGVWEFKFFHKPIDHAALENLFSWVRKTIGYTPSQLPPMGLERLLSNNSFRKIGRKAYRSALSGGSAEDINTTSLCVYSGPVIEHPEDVCLLHPWPGELLGGYPLHPYWGLDGDNRTASIFYTGDANLTNLGNRRELHDFLGPDRWAQVAILQVPHHGSRNNWETGAASEFSHRHSVFCADENHRFGHPHREVVLDLLNRGPLLANAAIGWQWQGVAYFR